jgi:secreted Zn-dependent insulinase-like peptidase
VKILCLSFSVDWNVKSVKFLISLIKDDTKRLFNEVKSISQSNWLCQEERQPTRNVTHYSREMSLYPVECWLKGRDSVEYNEEQIRSVISHMTMANCTTYLSSKSFEKLDGLITEPYTDAKYTIEDISLSVTDQVWV